MTTRYGYSNSIAGRMVRIQTPDGPIEYEATGDQLDERGWGWPIYCKFLRIEEDGAGGRTLTEVAQEDVALNGPADWAAYIWSIR